MHVVCIPALGGLCGRHGMIVYIQTNAVYECIFPLKKAEQANKQLCSRKLVGCLTAAGVRFTAVQLPDNDSDQQEHCTAHPASGLVSPGTDRPAFSCSLHSPRDTESPLCAQRWEATA